MKGYREDLAYVHDRGFGAFSNQAAPCLLKLLRSHEIRSGLIVDLGCGSGIWARILYQAGYDIFGVDQSSAMIRLARKCLPNGQFKVGSMFETKLPSCSAVTSLGESICYLFDERNSDISLLNLFRRIHNALQPRGIFIFDILEANPYKLGYPKRNFFSGTGWSILFEGDYDDSQKVLTRRIITFRKTGNLYRKDKEIHRVRVLNRTVIRRQLHQAGFRVQYLRSYGKLRLLPGRIAFLAKKTN